jgi:hypothetical protein
MHFEWGERKRQLNIEKHGLDFIRAARLFDGRSRLDVLSPRGRERRILSIGALEGMIIAVVWTQRGEDICRIISVRRARDEETRQYHEIYG